MAQVEPDGITVARPTPNATPVQKAVESAVKLDQPAARTSIPVSAKEAAIQTAQPVSEFTGNVQKGAEAWKGTAGYRPVGPKAPLLEPTFIEKMIQGAKYAPPKIEPTMGERMSGGYQYSPAPAQPISEFTGGVQKGSGLWKGTAGYRPVGPKQPLPQEGVPSPIQQFIESKTGVGPQSDVKPMTADEAVLQKSMSEAKAAGAERVAAAKAKAKVAGATPGGVEHTVSPSPADAWAAESKAVSPGKVGQAAKVAGGIIGQGLNRAFTLWDAASQYAAPAGVEEYAKRKAAMGDEAAKRVVESGGVNPILESTKKPIRAVNEYVGGKLVGAAEDLYKSFAGGQPASTQQPTATTQQPATPEQPAKPAPMTTQDTNLAPGTQLPGGGTVGKQEPVIDFSQRPATVPLKQGQTEAQRGAEIEKTAQERGQAVSKGSGGNFRYVQGPNGTIVKQNIDSGEVVPMSVQGITGNILKPGEESPLAREVQTRKAAQAEAKEAAFRDALMRMAQDQGDGTFTGMGRAKRNRRVATQLLEQMDRSKQAAAQMGMEEKKLASTDRATEATREQNALYKQQEAQDRKTHLGLEERKTVAAEEAAKTKAEAFENRPRTVTYKGEILKGTPEDIEIAKQQVDAKASAQWDKSNPKPSGLFTTNDDVVKHFEKRAKALGFDSNIAQAANLANQIKNLQGKLTPEDTDVVTKEFQSKYGVPYSEFIASE